MKVYQIYKTRVLSVFRRPKKPPPCPVMFVKSGPGLPSDKEKHTSTDPPIPFVVGRQSYSTVADHLPSTSSS